LIPIILVTGAAGFIACKVCEQLLRSGRRVLGIDNMDDAYDVRVKKWHLAQLLPYKNFTFTRLDVRNRKALDELSVADIRVDAVIHLAAKVGVQTSVKNAADTLATNLTGTLNLLEFCRKLEIPKFVLASSNTVYGNDPPLPTDEKASSDLPLQPCAASKKAAEVLCFSYHHLYKLDVTILRYFPVTGPGSRPDLAAFRYVQQLYEGKPLRIYGDGEQLYSFAYIDDVANATLLALSPMGYEIFNLGGTEKLSTNDLVQQLEHITGKKARIQHVRAQPCDASSCWADIAHASTTLGWVPKVEWKAGLERLVDWYNQERRWTSQVRTG
jgi:UDP-glucuronate 4-epimerase